MFCRYEEAKVKGLCNYSRELEDMIERLILECERKIQRALKRLEEEDAKAAVAISVSEVTQVHLTFPFEAKRDNIALFVVVGFLVSF